MLKTNKNKQKMLKTFAKNINYEDYLISLFCQDVRKSHHTCPFNPLSLCLVLAPANTHTLFQPSLLRRREWPSTRHTRTVCEQLEENFWFGLVSRVGRRAERPDMLCNQDVCNPAVLFV